MSKERAGDVMAESMGLEGWNSRSWGQECQCPLEARRTKERDSLLETPEAASTTKTLTLAQQDWFWNRDFQTSNWINLCYMKPQVYAHLSHSPQDTNTHEYGRGRRSPNRYSSRVTNRRVADLRTMPLNNQSEGLGLKEANALSGMASWFSVYLERSG